MDVESMRADKVDVYLSLLFSSFMFLVKDSVCTGEKS